MLKLAEKYGRNDFSQCNEDGIVEECFKRMKITNGFCAEFGAHNGKFCSNTFRLLESGWDGIMIEGDRDLFAQCCANVLGFACEVKNELVTPDNVNKLIPLNLNLLSIDTDGPCASIWQAYKGSPDIVIIEINSSLDPEKDFYSPEKGANYSYMKKLGESKGYFLLCHTGNMIFLLNKYKELFPDADPSFKTDWL